MTLHTTRQFRELFSVLPNHIQQQARQAYRLFQENPFHPGLHFKQVYEDPAIYSARVGIHYRAIGAVEAGAITWFWIGTHAHYDRLLKHL